MGIRQEVASRAPAVSGLIAFVVLGLVGFLLVSLSEKAWLQEKRFDAAEIASAEAVKLERKLVRLQFAAHLIESLIHNHRGDVVDFDLHLQELKDKFTWLAGYDIHLHPVAPGKVFQTDHLPAELPPAKDRWLSQQPDAIISKQSEGQGEGHSDGDQESLVLWQLVYLGLSDEEHHFWGIAEIRLPWRQFIQDTGLPGLKPRGYDYRLFAKESEPRFLDGTRPEALQQPFTQPIILSGVSWSLEVAPDHTWGNSPWYSWVAGLTLFVCLLLSGWVHMLVELPRRLRRQVEQRTAALNQQAALLEREVEDRKRIERQLRKEERLLRGLATAADWGIGDHFFDTAVDRLSALFGFDVVFIGEISVAAPDILQVRACCERGEMHKGFDLPFSSKLCGRVVSEGALCLPDRASRYLPEEHPFKTRDLQGYLGIPMIASTGQCIGVLACLRRQPIRDGERLLNYLAIFASRAAAELERQRAADELIKLSRVVEQSPTSVVITDTAGVIEYVNPAFVRSTGYAEEEAHGQTPGILKSGMQPEAFYQELWHTIKRGEDWQAEICNRRKDGSLYWEHSAIYPIRSSAGQITNYAAIKQDITERKAQEAKLKLSEIVFESVTEAILITDGERRITAVNPAFSRITGYSAAEVMGKTPSLFKSNRHDQAFYDEMRASLDQQGHWEGEIWNRRKNGEVFPEWLSIVAIRDTEGQVEQYVAVFSDITQRKREEERIRYQANYDALTQLPNRLLFEDRLASSLSLARRQHKQLALLFVDLDRFKWVNDSLGHKAGDLLLKVAAARLKGGVRESDTVARLGGDEFTLILSDLEQAEYAERVAQMLIEQLAKPFFLEGSEVEISASVGISLYPRDASSAEELIQHADAAMYEAKQAGRNRYRFYTQAINDLVHQRHQLESALKRGLEQQQFQLYFQPILNLATGACTGVEALLRWNHPECGVMLPSHFLPVAERIGLMGPLGNWVIEEAGRVLASWEGAAWAPPWISVNVSQRQCEGIQSVSLLEQLLSLQGVAAQRLVVEVTEEVMAEDSPLRPLMAELRSSGFSLAMDDFGCGDSPLAHLQSGMVDYMKVDASLVQRMPQDSGSEAMVRGLVQLAHSLDVKVIAEGVEQPEQHRLLQAMGCDCAQGYYYCRPVSLECLKHFLQSGCGFPENDEDQGRSPSDS